MAQRPDDDRCAAGLRGVIGGNIVNESGIRQIILEPGGNPWLNLIGEDALGLELVADLEGHHHVLLTFGSGGMHGLAVQDAGAQRVEIDDAGRGVAVAVIDGNIDISVLRKYLGTNHFHYSGSVRHTLDGGLETAVSAGHQRGVPGAGARKLIVDGHRLGRLNQHLVADHLVLDGEDDVHGQVTGKSQDGAVRSEG